MFIMLKTFSLIREFKDTSLATFGRVFLVIIEHEEVTGKDFT